MTDRERIAKVIKNTQAKIDEYRKNDKATFYQKGKADGMEFVLIALKNVFGDKQKDTVIIENAKHIVNIGRVEVFNG